MLKEAPMSYSRASELVKKELKSEGLDPSLYSLHGLRSGVLHLQQHLRFQIACSRDREDGEALRQKTVISRSHWTLCCYLRGKLETVCQ